MIYVKVTQLCLTLCDPTGCSTPDFPVHHQLPELDSEGRYEESQGLTGEGPWETGRTGRAVQAETQPAVNLLSS